MRSTSFWGVFLICGVATATTASATELFVANSSNNGQILRFDGTTGAFVNVLDRSTSLGGHLLGASSVAIGPDGLLYAPTQVNGVTSVVRYDTHSDAYLGVFASGGGMAGSPESLAFGPDGNLYVGNATNNGQILKFDGATGSFLNLLDRSDSLGGHLFGLNSMNFGPDGLLYAATQVNNVTSVVRYDVSSGAYLGVFASGGGMAGWPESLAFGPDGNLYVGDSTNSGQILKFNGMTGAFLGLLDRSKPLGGHLWGLNGLGFGPDGLLYAPTQVNGIASIVRYDISSGAYLGVFASGGGMAGWPEDLVFTPEPCTLLSFLLVGGCLVKGRARGSCYARRPRSSMASAVTPPRLHP